MITGLGGAAPTVPGTSPAVTEPGGVRLDQVVTGLMIGAAGLGWLLDRSGVSVGWRMYPASALILVGVALAVSLLGGRGRANLAALGAVLLVVSVGIGVGADRFAGPAGDLTITPAADAWPITVRRSAGSVTADLTAAALPASGIADIRVGAGRITLTVPGSAVVRIEADVVTGDITVDGVTVADGVDLDWTEPGTADATVVVRLAVAVGEIEVRHG
jgi:hypothetical protein